MAPVEPWPVAPAGPVRPVAPVLPKSAVAVTYHVVTPVLIPCSLSTLIVIVFVTVSSAVICPSTQSLTGISLLTFLARTR